MQIITRNVIGEGSHEVWCLCAAGRQNQNTAVLATSALLTLITTASGSTTVSVHATIDSLSQL